MKPTKILLLFLLFSLASVIARAQNATITHVIVVIQENRTPDNLFTQAPQLLANGANIWPVANPFPCKNVPGGVTLKSAALDACFDPDHGHLVAWEQTYDTGYMDGACTIPTTFPYGCTSIAYPANTYVANQKFDGVHGILDPYFQIATTYGFANYMFQTNQGPSFPAHQFLFAGTSAPVPYSDPSGLWAWFAGEIPTDSQHNPTPTAGCAAPAGTQVEDVSPIDGTESYAYAPPSPISDPGFPCYNHPTLASLLESNGKTWSYYAPPGTGNTMWTAPNALHDICTPVVGGVCTGAEWKAHVVPSPRLGDYAPILTDIATCALQSGVTWVVPDGAWSDHPGTAQGASDGGPSWVAAIVNAVGRKARLNDCPPSTGSANWENTVILITWDDWGGWYDHILPLNCPPGPGICTGYPNAPLGGTGNYYVYGFRVPLLVVSAYGTSQGYISGTAAQGGEVAPYIHDFGSILGYIEHVFKLPQGGIGSPSFPYADYFAPDTPPSCPACSYPLSDFFSSSPTPTSFVQINGAKYPPGCFNTPTGSGCFGSNYQPSDPDDDGIDPQD